MNLANLTYPPQTLAAECRLPTADRCRGFTLVEVMVAMVLTLFIMVILTQAFVISVDTFRSLKGIGDMQEHLRAGANQLRFDLSQNHFEGQRRTSDPGVASLVNVPPREGFLR